MRNNDWHPRIVETNKSNGSTDIGFPFVKGYFVEDKRFFIFQILWFRLFIAFFNQSIAINKLFKNCFWCSLYGLHLSASFIVELLYIALLQHSLLPNGSVL